MNWTLVEQVQMMLFNADLPKSYWFEALQYAALLHNISPTRSLDESTPDEAWSGNKPDVSQLHVFGSHAFVHIPDKLCDKFAAKSLVCMFLGYAHQRKAYHLMHRASCHFLESCNVIFDEGGATPHYEHIILKTDNAGDPPPLPTSSLTTSCTTPTLINSTTPTTPPSPNVTSCPKHTICTPTRDDDDCYSVTSYQCTQQSEHATVACTSTSDDPQMYAKAMSRPDAAKWDAACEEMNSFQRMRVYEVVP